MFKLHHVWKMKEIIRITDEKRKEGERSERKKKGEGSFGTRKLEMITHLLNLYSTLLGLRRKKKGEVFHSLLLLFFLHFFHLFGNFLLHFKCLSLLYYVFRVSFHSFFRSTQKGFIGCFALHKLQFLIWI